MAGKFSVSERIMLDVQLSAMELFSTRRAWCNEAVIPKANSRAD